MLLLLGQSSRLPSPAVSPALLMLVASLGHEEFWICSWVGAWTPCKAKSSKIKRFTGQRWMRTGNTQNWTWTVENRSPRKALTIGLWYKTGQSSSPCYGLESLGLCSIPWKNSFGCPCQGATSICTSSVLHVKMSDKIGGVTNEVKWNMVSCSNS